MAAFASAIKGRSVFGNKRVTWGTFTPSGGSTGGDINTGLRRCESILLQYGGAAAITDAAVVNETLPCSGAAVTIVTVADKAGTWIAIGTGHA